MNVKHPISRSCGQDRAMQSCLFYFKLFYFFFFVFSFFCGHFIVGKTIRTEGVYGGIKLDEDLLNIGENGA